MRSIVLGTVQTHGEREAVHFSGSDLVTKMERKLEKETEVKHPSPFAQPRLP